MGGVFGRSGSLEVSFWSSRAHLLHTARRLGDGHWWGASGVDGSGIASGVSGGPVEVVVCERQYFGGVVGCSVGFGVAGCWSAKWTCKPLIFEDLVESFMIDRGAFPTRPLWTWWLRDGASEKGSVFFAFGAAGTTRAPKLSILTAQDLPGGVDGIGA